MSRPSVGPNHPADRLRRQLDLGAAGVVAPDDPGALGAAIIGLLKAPQAREALASGALSAAVGPYSWEASARETLALYRDLVG